jgi:hypothetical protein
MQAVREYMGCCFAPWNEFSIGPNKTIAVGHRHVFTFCVELIGALCSAIDLQNQAA